MASAAVESRKTSNPFFSDRPPIQVPSTTFDIVSYYNNLISSDPTLAPPVAAIDSLIALLSANPLTTISETDSLLSSAADTLLQSVSDPIPLSAGTGLFRRYLNTEFGRPELSTAASFPAVREALIRNSQLFVSRAKQARRKIAQHALPFIKEDTTVFTYGFDLTVHAALLHAASEQSNRYFRVVYVLPPHSQSRSLSSPQQAQITALRDLSIPVTTIPFSALIYSLLSLPTWPPPLILTGASAVLENGGVISTIGCHPLAVIAKSLKTAFYICTESYNFVQSFPLGYGKKDLERMGVKQDTLGGLDQGSEDSEKGLSGDEMIELTPPELIEGLITENGVMTPSAVSEELIKLWF